MTEDEARTRWCPFARVLATVDSAPAAVNRFLAPESEGPEIFTACIASECMAFRWSVDDPEAYDKGQAPGYCGLAGKP